MKFNTKAVEASIRNKEGAKAYALSDKEELITKVLTSLVGEPKFYTTGKESDEELLSSIRTVLKRDPEFILKLAVYARNEMYLRSVPLVLLVEYANATTGMEHTRKYVPAVVKRVDEITELIALQLKYNTVYGRVSSAKLPMFIKNGLAEAFNRFNEYHFAKYNRDGTVKLRDALYLCHPSPKDQHQQDIFDMISSDTLPTPETWETYISGHGSNKATWEYIIPKMGYMALLRNLRNFIENDVDIGRYVIPKLIDKKAILQSKQLPYRFYSAYNEIQKLQFNYPLQTDTVLRGLNTAINISVDNVPHIPGSTFIAVDNSGSMHWANISGKSKITYSDISCLFGSMASRICDNAVVSVFAEGFDIVGPSPDVLRGMKDIQNCKVGHATYAYKVLDYMNRMNVYVDRILLFSDMQVYGGDIQRLYSQYKTHVNPNVRLYCFDLSGYGTQIMRNSDKSVLTISGWSEKVFDFIKLNEIGAGNMVKTIDSISI